MIDEILQKQARFLLHEGGVLPDPEDHRDFDAEELMGSNLNIEVNWSKGFSALEVWPDMPNKDQKSTYSCVGQAWSNYKQILQAKDTGEKTLLSPKSIYNPIAFPFKGSYVRSGGLQTVNVGVAKESSVPSDDTEEKITAPCNLSPFKDEMAYFKNLTIASVNTQNFDTLAKMILLNNGLVSGWGAHCQYFKDFGVMGGSRFLKTHNSYGLGSDMYYFEDFHDPLFSCWTAVDVKNIEKNPRLKLNNDLRYGDVGTDVLLLRQKLTENGWVNNTQSSAYNNELAETVYRFQLANLDHRLFLEVILNLRGRKVGPATRNILNQ